MAIRSNAFRALFTTLLIAVCAVFAAAQNVKRVVIVKIDGLPGYYVDRFVGQLDPETGRSVLPWIEEVFYKNGTRVPNFYTRGISLSAPSWSMLDTGQHLQIKGNQEYDRYTLHAYDYLNFIPYTIQYGMRTKVDMPGAELMDQLKIPLMCDIFTTDSKYTSQQLFQRGNNLKVLAKGLANIFPRKPDDLIDEWTVGLDLWNFSVNQNQRDIIDSLKDKPQIDYLDYFSGDFDHVSHSNNDTVARLAVLRNIDRLIGRVWTAIQASTRTDETALILVSDHGINSDERVYSQGYSLVKLLQSSAGGGHHVITTRRLMLDYSLKGIYPFVPLIRNASDESYYLKGQSGSYPTALMDFDGNERASIHLRENDLNILQILLGQLRSGKLSPEVKTAVTDAFFDVISDHREGWQETVFELNEELDALDRWVKSQKAILAKQPKKNDAQNTSPGVIKKPGRLAALTDIAAGSQTNYRRYISTLSNLLDLKRSTFDPAKLKIEDYIAKNAFGESNSVYQLQNYVVGLSPNGLTLNADGKLDMGKSFARVNYFELLHDQTVRNNVQKSIGNRPVDFIAVRIPIAAISDALPNDLRTNEDPIWLFGDRDKQALILSRAGGDGGQSFRYLPVAGLRQDASGKITFQAAEWADGFPLKYFEDPNFAIPLSGRAAWLGDWHTEIEWLNASHKTVYSNALIGLNEQLQLHPLFDGEEDSISRDERLIRRFRQRQRRLAEADLLILANNHWNFDVRGFNPGGNHGSFFRVSSNSTFMIAGGAKTGIPSGLIVEQPYDGLSFMPTVLRLMGKIDDENRPVNELSERGFRRFPGRVIKEIAGESVTAK